MLSECHLVVGGKGDDMLLLPVIDSLEVLTAADGPVYGVGGDTQLLLYLLAELKWVPGLPVHLIYKGKNGYMPHSADLEELSGLILDTLGGVDYHYCRVGSHKGAVGVLREVLMSRGIQNINAEALVLELHNGRGNGNSSLLFYLHPVGDCVAGVFLSLYGTCLCDSSAVEQELLCESCFTCVGVRDYGKGTPSVYFLLKLGQSGFLPLFLLMSCYDR